MDGVIGVLVPVLIMNLASNKVEVRTLTQEVMDVVLSHVDTSTLIPHFTSGVSSHANLKVKVVLLQLLSDLVATVYTSNKSYLVMKHVVPLAFKLMDEKKGELRSSNIKLLQSLFNAMGSSLWENSSLSKQDQGRLQELVTNTS